LILVYSRLCAQAHLLKNPVMAQMCLSHDVVTLHHSGVGLDGLPMGHFWSYIRRLPVRLAEARGDIVENTWKRFFAFAARAGSRFPSLDAPDRLPRAVLFTSAHVAMADYLYQRFSAPSPNSVPKVTVAVGMLLTVGPPCSGSGWSSVVPVSVGPLFSESGLAFVIEVADSDSAASDPEIPGPSGSVRSSVAPVSVSSLFSGSGSPSMIEEGILIRRFRVPGLPSLGIPAPSAHDVAGGVGSSVVRCQLALWFLFRL
jgi:hypothetical protein